MLGKWGKRERRTGKEKQARSHKNDIEKKILLLFLMCTKREKKRVKQN